MSLRSVIRNWNPEAMPWHAEAGEPIALRNLSISVACLVLSFAVWMVWSVVVVHLPAAGFHYSTHQRFWLVALPALCGATLRVFYAFGVPLLGGRRLTVLTTASLLVPAVGLGLAVQDPTTPFEWMVVLALLCGLGGGNFASSMAHISFLYPVDRQGTALGLNAGLGHLGVALAQWLVPVVLGVGMLGPLGGPAQVTPQGPMWLQNAGFVWVPLILACTLAAALGMNDLADVRARFADQAVIFTRKHTWLMCWLYLGSFGSFIGFSASLPVLAQSLFQQPDGLHWVWLGPLMGAVLRPLGGWWADRRSGAQVSLWCFAALALGALLALAFLPGRALGGAQGDFEGFLAAFALTFAAAGMGTGAGFRMLCTVFVAERQRQAEPLPQAQAQATREGAVEAAAALGLASAIGAYGGFFIPKSVGSSLALTGSPAAALALFIVFYLSCVALVWWACSRPNAPLPC